MAAVYTETMSLTRSPSPPTPTTMGTNTNDSPAAVPGTPVAGDGLRTTSLLALTVSCIANSSTTLAGGGALQCWVFDPVANLWLRAPDLDLSLSWGAVTAQRGRVWPALRNPARFGARINFLTSGVTVNDASTDVQVTIKGFAGSFPS